MNLSDKALGFVCMTGVVKDLDNLGKGRFCP